jgi:hypothetical protein
MWANDDEILTAIRNCPERAFFGACALLFAASAAVTVFGSASSISRTILEQLSSGSGAIRTASVRLATRGRLEDEGTGDDDSDCPHDRYRSAFS